MGRAPIMARVGLVRMGLKRIAAPLPEPARSSMIAEDGTLAATRTLVAEMASFYDDLRHLRDVPLALPDVPVSVISGLVTSRSEEHTSELQSLMRISYDVFCLKKKTSTQKKKKHEIII